MAHVLVILSEHSIRQSSGLSNSRARGASAGRLREAGTRRIPYGANRDAFSWRLTGSFDSALRAPLRMTKQPVGSVQDDGSLQVEPCRFRHQGEQLVVRQGDVDLGEVAHGVHGGHCLRYQHPGAVVHLSLIHI